MTNKSMLIVAVLVLIALGLGFQLGQSTRSDSRHAPLGMHATMTMDEMTDGLKGKTGDEFDKAFIESMIVHHEGAVEMAKLIPGQAKHAELKKLGEAIIDAQTQEIDMMRGWLKSWGYAK